MKHLDQIKLILFMIVKVMIYLWAKLLLMLEKVLQLYLLLFGKMFNVDWGFPFLLIPF